jgi:tetratricopeptide (TPR) repeat protein
VAWTVITTAFVGDQTADRDTPWPEAKGPILLPGAEATAETRSVTPPVEQPAKPDELPAPLPPSPASIEARPLEPPEAVKEIPKSLPAEAPPAVAATGPRVLQLPPPAEPVRAANAGRSRQLESIAQEADRHSRQGYELAGRGAYYAARREFTSALRLMAQGLDMEHQTTRHSRALAAGLTAVAEAEDFVRLADRLETDTKVADIVARHRTPVLKGAAENAAPMEATKSYFTFAQEQLAVAAGHEIAGSMALHGLGKLHVALGQQGSPRIRAAQSKAITFYQASLLVDPRNFLASNDLGVLLARAGSYVEARAALEHSVAIGPQAAGWRNLAEIYRRLGEQQRAARAEQLFRVAARDEAGSRNGRTSVGRVEWLGPQAFAQTFAQAPDAREPLPTRQPAARPAQPAPANPVAQNPFSTLFEKRQ